MRISVNLATKTYYDQKKITLTLRLVQAVLLLLLVACIGWVIGNSAELRKLKSDNAKLDQRLNPRGVAVSEWEYRAMVARIGMVNGIIDKKVVNWIELLNRLELVVPDGVSLTMIEPDLEKRSLKVSGAAKKFSGLRTFMENLENSAYFSKVYLVSQKDIKENDATTGIAFQISTGLVM